MRTKENRIQNKDGDIVDLFLTQMIIDKTDAARQRLTDAYAWHNSLWQCFPGKDGAKRKFLFRCEEHSRDFAVLIVSSDKPEVPIGIRGRTKSIPDLFLSHSMYRFQIKANPTMRRKSDKRRIGIYASDKLHQWMERKALANGFSLVGPMEIIGPVDSPFFRKGKIGKHTWADFKGVLKVEDQNLFQKGFQNGIGSAKAFGYGMLMLEPTVR